MEKRQGPGWRHFQSFDRRSKKNRSNGFRKGYSGGHVQQEHVRSERSFTRSLAEELFRHALEEAYSTRIHLSMSNIRAYSSKRNEPYGIENCYTESEQSLCSGKRRSEFYVYIEAMVYLKEGDKTVRVLGICRLFNIEPNRPYWQPHFLEVRLPKEISLLYCYQEGWLGENRDLSSEVIFIDNPCEGLVKAQNCQLAECGEMMSSAHA